MLTIQEVGAHYHSRRIQEELRREVVEERSHSEVEAVQNQEDLEGLVVEQQPLLPYIVDSTGYMQHSHRKQRKDPHQQGVQYHSTERTEQHNQLPLSDYLHQGQKELLGS